MADRLAADGPIQLPHLAPIEAPLLTCDRRLAAAPLTGRGVDLVT